MSEHNEVSLRQAANWHARLHSHDCSAADREAFERWLQSDPSCRAAYEQVSLAAQRAAAAMKADPRLRALAADALGTPRQPAESSTPDGTSDGTSDGAPGGPPASRRRQR